MNFAIKKRKKLKSCDFHGLNIHHSAVFSFSFLEKQFSVIFVIGRILKNTEFIFNFKKAVRWLASYKNEVSGYDEKEQKQ